mgnify:CR=1 FL=1
MKWNVNHNKNKIGGERSCSTISNTKDTFQIVRTEHFPGAAPTAQKVFLLCYLKKCSYYLRTLSQGPRRRKYSDLTIWKVFLLFGKLILLFGKVIFLFGKLILLFGMPFLQFAGGRWSRRQYFLLSRLCSYYLRKWSWSLRKWSCYLGKWSCY